jgi:hypothetical protein
MGRAHIGGHLVAATGFPKGYMMETFSCCRPIAFPNSCRRGLSWDSELGFQLALLLLGIVLQSSVRSLPWINQLLLLGMGGRGAEGKEFHLRVMI